MPEAQFHLLTFRPFDPVELAAMRSKALLFRCGSGRVDNIDALLCPALEADCLRLGLLAAAVSSDDQRVGH